MSPFFSVIIPTYNRAELIKDTLLSLQKQTFEDFEVIVVDDGGSDNTEEVVNLLNDKRFRYFWKENAERGAARNYGAKHAKGNFLNFFDSDDIAYINHLQSAFNFIHKNPSAQIFHTNFEHKTIDGKLLVTNSFKGKLNNSIQKKNILSCNNVFIEYGIAIDNPFSIIRNLSGSEDWLLWLQLSQKYEITAVEEVTSVIIQHYNRSMITANGKSTEERTSRIIHELRKSKSTSIDIVSNVSAEMYSLSSLYYAIGKEKYDAIRCYFIAVKFKPSIILSKRFLATMKYLIFKW